MRKRRKHGRSQAGASELVSWIFFILSVLRSRVRLRFVRRLPRGIPFPATASSPRVMCVIGARTKVAFRRRRLPNAGRRDRRAAGPTGCAARK